MTARWARRTATTLAAVAVASLVCLILFFVVGGPFGTINDFGNGLLAVLCAALALLLYRPGRTLITTVAVAGAATSAIGSSLVISESTGYFLAGLVSASGFALVGFWLVAVSRSKDLPASRSALLAGAVMAIGIVNVPGILLGMDDQGAAPTWLLAAGICWGGTYLLMPIWATRFARRASRPSGSLRG
jgi:hypothetical protein